MEKIWDRGTGSLSQKSKDAILLVEVIPCQGRLVREAEVESII